MTRRDARDDREIVPRGSMSRPARRSLLVYKERSTSARRGAAWRGDASIHPSIGRFNSRVFLVSFVLLRDFNFVPRSVASDIEHRLKCS